MSRLERALREFVSLLDELDLPYAVVGGLAVSARTEPRFTRDADICVALDTDAEAEALVQRLRGEGYAIVSLVEQEAVGRIATVRLTSAGTGSEGVVLDLLFASSGIEREVVDGAEVIDLFEGLAVPLASLPALVAQKILARDDVRRPQDRLDLVKLLEVASEADLVEAERLLGLITARGYARRRSLIADLHAIADEIRRD